uniref:Uncharacterized protein n=1 Tax=Gossypium raimondii TaxID=29730 RepID=A0A0D2RLH7_GOSRA|nr:hypothetical protein B456_005G144900 [Gossypium raimondii]
MIAILTSDVRFCSSLLILCLALPCRVFLSICYHLVSCQGPLVLICPYTKLVCLSMHCCKTMGCWWLYIKVPRC